MGAKELREAIENKKISNQKEQKKIELIEEVKKRAFLNKYFKIKTGVNSQVAKDIKVIEESFNQVYLKTFNNKQRTNIYYGGSGSGKSEYIARRYILKFLFEKGHNGLFLRKVDKDVKRSIYPLLKKVLNEYLGKNKDKYVKINQTDKSFTFYNGNQILCAGLDDEERMKSITFEHGILTDVWMEEANQMIGTEIKEINRRLRGKTSIKKEIVISFNPVSKNSWLYLKYFNLSIEAEKFYKDSKKLILKTTVYDNKYATEEDVKTLEDEEDPYDKEVYLFGNFGVISANDCIVTYSDAMHCTDLEAEILGEIYIGLDCAGLGDDSTVAKVRKGARQLDCGFKLHKAEEEEVLQELISLIDTLQSRYKTENPDFDETKEISELNKPYFLPDVTVNIDTTGVGYGVGSQMRTRIGSGIIENVIANSISFGGKAKNDERYFNIVTEMYFNLRNLCKLREIQLLKETVTINELTSRKYFIDQKSSRRRIEPKDRFKKRLKKSPDDADALCLAFYVAPKGTEGYVVTLEYEDYCDEDGIYDDNAYDDFNDY